LDHQRLDLNQELSLKGDPFKMLTGELHQEVWLNKNGKIKPDSLPPTKANMPTKRRKRDQKCSQSLQSTSHLHRDRSGMCTGCRCSAACNNRAALGCLLNVELNEQIILKLKSQRFWGVLSGSLPEKTRPHVEGSRVSQGRWTNESQTVSTETTKACKQQQIQGRRRPGWAKGNLICLG
jgi:hypothetical protein